MEEFETKKEVMGVKSGKYYAAGLLSSFVYTGIIYTLTVSFGDIGKALSSIYLWD